jgi:methionyl-tRNA formyltransferase
MSTQPKIIVLCTVSTGLDAVLEICRRGFSIEMIVGLHPKNTNLESVSGYIDVAKPAKQFGIPFLYVKTYGLSCEEDINLFKKIEFDLVWVAGWQRLVPGWLIRLSRFGVIGGHGSPDGIIGGRGRSPQNWALMLGCRQFDLALFVINEAVDEGPILAERSFAYRDTDDIQISYYRASLAIADMVCELLANPELILHRKPQSKKGFYYPQRKPEDGRVDWSLPSNTIMRHCRALTKPYPGLKTSDKESKVAITIWDCVPFDDVIDGGIGSISQVFFSGEFLVNCLDGRLLVRRWNAECENWIPKTGFVFETIPFSQQISTIVNRHLLNNSGKEISQRILQYLQ